MIFYICSLCYLVYRKARLQYPVKELSTASFAGGGEEFGEIQ